jgi:hypothetical protein
MRITVHIYAYLRYYLPAGEKSVLQKEWEMPEGATIKQALEKLNLPQEVQQ